MDLQTPGGKVGRKIFCFDLAFFPQGLGHIVHHPHGGHILFVPTGLPHRTEPAYLVGASAEYLGDVLLVFYRHIGETEGQGFQSPGGLAQLLLGVFSHLSRAGRGKGLGFAISQGAFHPGQQPVGKHQEKYRGAEALIKAGGRLGGADGPEGGGAVGQYKGHTKAQPAFFPAQPAHQPGHPIQAGKVQLHAAGKIKGCAKGHSRSSASGSGSTIGRRHHSQQADGPGWGEGVKHPPGLQSQEKGEQQRSLSGQQQSLSLSGRRRRPGGKAI